MVFSAPVMKGILVVKCLANIAVKNGLNLILAYLEYMMEIGPK